MPNPQPMLRVSPDGRRQSTGTEQAAAPSQKRGIHALGLPVWILIGATAGILAGIVFGERTVILRPVGSAYGMLLEGAVYPYLLSSLLYGLGRLAPAMARRLLSASWAVYLFMWSTTFAAIWLLACAIPATPLPTVLTPDTAQRHTSFLHLLIPDNLFEALGRNYVPAVVVFAIVYGIAIQKVQNKSALFEILGAVQAASVTIWGWIVRLAPFGVFALFATAAGTIEPNQLGGLLLYVGLFLVGTLLLAFVVLPAVLTTVAPVSYREVRHNQGILRWNEPGDYGDSLRRAAMNMSQSAEGSTGMARSRGLLCRACPTMSPSAASGASRWFFAADDYRIYRRLVATAARRAGTAVWAYCLMPNHLHLPIMPTWRFHQVKGSLPDRAWVQRAVGESVRSCPRAGCGKSAHPVR